jgi:thiol-disulfide isomerase/thioredoxin
MKPSVPVTQMSFSGGEEDALFLNDGHGHFQDCGFQARLDDRGDGRSSVFADLDGDGDLDLVLRQLQAPKLEVYRNDLDASRHWARVALEGVQSNRMGVGALVRARTGETWQTLPIRAGHGFLSQGPAEAHFGLGAATKIDELEIDWPSGQTSRFTAVPVDRLLHVREGAATPEVLEPRRTPLGPPALPGLDLGALGLEPAPGKPTLVNLWSPGCAPCAAEAPGLVAHARTCGAAATFVALAPEAEAGVNPAAAAKLGIELPLASASEMQMRLLDHALDGVGFPTTLVFDAQGHLTTGVVGAVTPEVLEQMLPCGVPSP